MGETVKTNWGRAWSNFVPRTVEEVVQLVPVLLYRVMV
jgi:hypothetical protein